jgi:hypothetical protein
MKHGDHHIGMRQVFRCECGVCRDRAGYPYALAAQLVQNRNDNLDLLATQISTFSRMWIKAADQETGADNALTFL